jgi:hypothetical protein
LRVTDLLALKGAEPGPSPERNPLAYFLALFVPGGQTAAPANALILIVVIGLLAAMAIPAFQKVRQASITMTCVNHLGSSMPPLSNTVWRTGRLPPN